MTTGRRVYPDEEGHLWLQEGDYGQHPNGVWHARPPGCHTGTLEGHEVTEHEDGTITVSPSILLKEGDGQGGLKETWHGYLRRGVWEQC